MEVPGKRTDVDDEEEKLENLEKMCELCEADNINTHASCFCNECEEYMCTACFRQHLRAKSCRHHTLMEIDSPLETCFKWHSRAAECKQHEGEVIKFYCRKHEVVGCGDCMILGHNACKLEYIKDLSNNFQQNEEYKSSMRKIEKLISDRKKSEQKIQENKEYNKVMLEKALRDIKQFRLDINKHLDKVEEDIISQAVNIMEENETLLTKLASDCMTLSTELEEITNMLNSELYKDNVLFINTVECKPKLTETEKAISDMKSKSTKKYKFVSDEQLRSLVTSAQKLGILAISSSTVFLQTIDRSSKKGKSQGNAGNNAEGTPKRVNIRNEDVGGHEHEKAGVRSGVRVGARVKHSSIIGTFLVRELQGQIQASRFRRRTYWYETQVDVTYINGSKLSEHKLIKKRVWREGFRFRNLHVKTKALTIFSNDSHIIPRCSITGTDPMRPSSKLLEPV